MVKKKKPAANPNRGFATTSIASKPKPEKQIASDSPAAGSDTENDSISATKDNVGNSNSNIAEAEKELHELSPDELEKRLDENELQGLVEKISTKCARDATRYVGKLQTDYRVARKQTLPLYTQSLLPDDLILQILNLAQSNSNDGDYFFSESSRGPSDLNEEERIAQIWTLQQSLLSMGFEQAHVDAASDHVLRFPPDREPPGIPWGMSQAYDWLILNLEDRELPHIDERSGHARIQSKSITNNSMQVGELAGSKASSEHGSDTHASGSVTSRAHSDNEIDPKTLETPPSPVDDIEVSDVDSDLEPEELISTYLNTKSRLFTIQPELFESKAQISKTASRNGLITKGLTTAGAKKLKQKMEKIESDVLFDQYQADEQWIDIRNQLAREAAARKRLQLPIRSSTNAPTNTHKRSGSTRNHSSPFESAGEQTDRSVSSEDGDADDAIRDLFASLPSNDSGLVQEATEDGSSVQIRDFGSVTGIGARRILEEVCRARDSRVRLNYSIISKAAFSNRHKLVIAWSKDQELGISIQPMRTISQAATRSCTFAMEAIACPDAKQSEAYVSVLALFQIFHASAKESNAYLRLQPNWKELYMEFMKLQKSKIEAEDRNCLRAIRDKVRQSMDADPELEKEDVVYTRNFRRRFEDSERSRSRNHEFDIREPNATELERLWRDKASTVSYQQMLQFRMTLPMYGFREAALAAVDQNQVTIICGETGCGKSTQFPQYLLEHDLRQGKPCRIYCTEPRRISAITLAQRVSQELGENKMDLGTMRSLVGYAIRLESQTSRSTRLVYATTGIVLRMLESGDGLKDVTHIVIDEVHERSIETDFLLIILKSLIISRPDLKIILMSATVDAQRFASYFAGAPILNVPGRTFPVECRYLEDAIQATGYVIEGDDQRDNTAEESDDGQSVVAIGDAANSSDLSQYNAATRRTLLQFDEYRIPFNLLIALISEIAFGSQYQQYNQAILVFLPGIGEIKQMNDLLSGTVLSQGYVIHSLHSAIPSEDQQRAFDPPPWGKKKIVLSTNIAETGVTIPDVTCVIDTGKHKEMRFDEKRQVSRLIESFISRANAKQRRGRAGRVQPGLCFHLFTKHRHDNIMATEQTPEMLRLSLQDLVMRVKICKLGDIQSTLADALDPPSSKNVRRAIDALIEVGALTSKEELTPLGQQLSKLPLDPYLGKLVLHGVIFSCLDITLTLAAILTSKSPFTSPLHAQRSADAARAGFYRSDSDLLTDYNAYSSWRRVCTTNPNHEPQFCRRNFLSSQTLSNIEDLKAQLLSQLADGGLVSLSPPDRNLLSRIQNSSSSRPGRRKFVLVPDSFDANSENTTLVTTVIAWSLYPKLLIRDGKGWRNVANSQTITIHPTSVLRSGPASASEAFARATFLSFYSILQSSHGARHYNASSLTPVSPLGLVLLAGDVAFNAYTSIITLDSARSRFLVEKRTATAQNPREFSAAKTLVALKFLRRRLEEIVLWRWQQQYKKDIPDRLRGWWDVWVEICRVWSKRTESY